MLTCDVNMVIEKISTEENSMDIVSNKSFQMNQ